MKTFLLPGLLFLFCLALASQTTPSPNSQPFAKPPAAQGTAPAKNPEIAPPADKQVDVDVPATPPGAAPLPETTTASAADTSADAKARARRAYIVGPEDVLMIKVWQEPNLSGQVTVGPDGMISLQLIDEVKADGLTTEQLKGVLTQKLKGFINNPDVNVQVLRVNSRKFIIQGEISRPGSFPLTGPTTVMEALVNGGGFREFANVKKIYILRTEVDPKTNKPETKKFNFNYKEVSHGKKMEQNIFIQNGDQIFVP